MPTVDLETSIFCELVAGKLPISVIDATEDVLALMDIQPVNPGHVLIIPKRHAPYLADDLRNDQISGNGAAGGTRRQVRCRASPLDFQAGPRVRKLFAGANEIRTTSPTVNGADMGGPAPTTTITRDRSLSVRHLSSATRGTRSSNPLCSTGESCEPEFSGGHRIDPNLFRYSCAGKSNVVSSANGEGRAAASSIAYNRNQFSEAQLAGSTACRRLARAIYVVQTARRVDPAL